MTELKISVKGTPPRPWGSDEWEWRKAIADHAHEFRPQAVSHSKNSKFTIKIIFWISSSRLGMSDLDNLAKPVLDTLFHSRYAQVKDKTLTGALFDVDDDRVFKLVLEKKLALSNKDEGADITTSW